MNDAPNQTPALFFILAISGRKLDLILDTLFPLLVSSAVPTFNFYLELNHFWPYPNVTNLHHAPILSYLDYLSSLLS